MRFTFDDLLKLREIGVFKEGEHVELVGGEFITMPSEGGAHSFAVAVLMEWLSAAIADEPDRSHRLYAHATLLFAPDHRREPDLLVANRIGPDRVLTPADVHLVIETATTSAATDLNDKRTEYAAAGVPEYWVWETGPQRLTVFRRPQDGDYAFKDTLVAGQSVAPLFAPGATFEVATLAG